MILHGAMHGAEDPVGRIRGPGNEEEVAAGHARTLGRVMRGRAGAGRPRRKRLHWRRRALNNSCAAPLYIALCAFFHKPRSACPAPIRFPGPTSPAALLTRAVRRRHGGGGPGPRPGSPASGARPPSPGVRPGSSPSARRRCPWRGPRSSVLARAEARARRRPGRGARGGRLARTRAPGRRRRPSGARRRLARRRRGARRRSRERVAPERRGLGAALRRHHQPARRAGRRHRPRGAHRALRPAARLRPRHHRHEPHPQALLPLGRRPARRGARAGPGPGLRRLRRHRRRPRRRSAPVPASPTPRPPPRCASLLQQAGLWDRIPGAGAPAS